MTKITKVLAITAAVLAFGTSTASAGVGSDRSSWGKAPVERSSWG